MNSYQLIQNKIIKLQDIVKNVSRTNQLYKIMGFLEATELNACLVYAETIYLKLKKEQLAFEAKTMDDDFNDTINTLQDIVGDISTLISLYGCEKLENLIHICIGHNYKIDEKYVAKYNLLNTYVKPVRYKILDWHAKLKPTDDTICKTADNFECFDFKNEIFDIIFQNRVYGIKFAIHNIEKQHTLIVYGIIEDVATVYIENSIIQNKLVELDTGASGCKKTYERFVNCLTLKEIVVLSTSKLIQKYHSYLEQFKIINKKPLVQVINEFVAKEIYDKRNVLIMLIINSAENECHYLAYLLYDLLSNDINGIIDTYEQTLIYDSLPYQVKKYFRDIMKQIVVYTNTLSNTTVSKIPLEQRICLMKTSDIVKEKAMVKLKEVKMKSEDTGSKAMQFLDGLLKIPFEIYKEEPVLKLMSQSIKLFSNIVQALEKTSSALPFPVKETYTSFEIQKYIPTVKSHYKLHANLLQKTQAIVATCTRNKMLEFYEKLKHCIQDSTKEKKPLKLSGKTITQLREEFMLLLTDYLKNDDMLDEMLILMETITQTEPLAALLNKNLKSIEQNMKEVHTFMGNVANTLDLSVYGHTNAKRQIERIIGQWINGDITGYCFGFEGPPGVGKTSLAKKGIAQCLLDEHGVARPFAFIAMGGSTNSSTLDGHNYTYVGSTWGRIVDILMDTKIMNPIIFIDELDKVSKTENGKEIIGILTHLIDQTQNDTFQDKYFNGINLNLSKALFIFSYNDADLIDRILLDRIHRIKFETISVEDKLIIVRNFILPEIYKKMGLENMISISDNVIETIINDYTAEPGVRKLKELLFEIIGEINLNILKNTIALDIPLVITVEDIKTNYLKEHVEVRPIKIHAAPRVGVINGMWANAAGKGGILPIEAAYYPASAFLELKLTGMQGDVMKESMTVAKSLAWALFVKSEANALEKIEKTQGLHVHVPEAATPKDGPSAGTAITMVLYSLFSGRQIKNDVAITGEICLQGRVSAIGGLELKILGGLRAGIKTFIYPQENEKDFEKFMKKYATKPALVGKQFFAVETIEEVIPLIFQ